jgi:hypothetical protein
MRRNVPDLYDKLNQDIGPISCAGYKSGHFALFRTPQMVSDNLWACDEDEYLRAAASAGAWGAVNHPDNRDGGSRWYCWNDGDSRTWDESLPSAVDEVPGVDRKDAPGCPTSAVGRTEAARSIELVNDLNMPSAMALKELDSLLLQGDRVAVVGGGDSHTSRPDGNPLPKTKIGPIQIPVVNVGVGRQQPGNDGKLGLAGRTWLPLDQDDLPDDPTDPDDPVRRMILEGRTVATTGPLGLPSIAGRYPGDDAVFTGESMDVRVDFRGARVVTDDGVVDDWDDAYGEEEMRARTRQSARPALVVVVIGPSNVCPREADATESDCAGQVTRIPYPVSEAEAEAGTATIRVPVPADLSAGFLRTETYFGEQKPKADDRFADGREWQDGAFSSPIWLVRDPFAVTPTALDEPCAHAAYPPPVGVTGPVSCMAIVEADLDGNGKPDRLAVWRRSDDPRPVQGTPDQANGAVAYLDDGSYHFLEEPTPNWAQPPDVLFPHAVVDLNGAGRQEVLLTSLIGANTDHYGVLSLTADRRLHAVRTRDEVQYLTAGGGAGYGSGYGCVTSGGGRLVADVGRSSDSSAAGPYGAAFSWRATYSRLEDGTFTVLGSQGGYRTADTGDALLYALGGNSCSGKPPDIGIVQPPATDIAGALRGLLQAAARGDEVAGRYFVSGAAYPQNAPRDAWAAVRSLPRLPASTAEPQCRAVVESFGLPQPPYSPIGRTLCHLADGGVAVDALLSRDGNGQWVVDALAEGSP